VNGHIFPELDDAGLGLSFRQPKILYRNIGGERFEDVSATGGAVITTPAAARGAAFGDFDNDGRLDVVINNMHDAPSLLHAQTQNQNHWLQVRLEGVQSNRSAVGARVACVTGKFRQIQEVRSGGSFFSQSDLRLHFGLGDARHVAVLEIRWPDGSMERVVDCDADQIISVKQGSGIVSRKP
jgi:hypothetical protein